MAGGRTEALRGRLQRSGFACEVAQDADDAVSRARHAAPDAVVVSGQAARVGAVVLRLRSEPSLAGVPVLARGSARDREALRSLDLDAVVPSDVELVRSVEASLRARDALSRDARARRRLTLLVELPIAVADVAEPEALFARTLPLLQPELEPAQVFGLVQDGVPRTARLVDAQGRVTPLELAASPHLARVLAATRPGHYDGYEVHPLVSEADHASALVLRSVGPKPPPEDLELLGQAARALLGSARGVHAQAALKRQAQVLEAAYLDRYQELLGANRRLEEADRWKDELLAVCSHDLRSPLNVLLGHAAILKAQPDVPADVSAGLDKIDRQGRKLAELVERLLERSRGGHALTLEAAPIDLAALAKEELQSFEVMAKERGVTLRCEAPATVTVVGDELKLRQVMQNLLGNAFEHARGMTTLTVRVQRLARPGGDVARLSVHDDGASPPQEQLATLFDRHRSDGRGLGLHICREVVGLHGGEIWAEQAPAGGTVFAVTLATEREPLPRAPAGERPLVLLVEDDAALARTCAEALSAHYQVELAHDGNEGVARARALRPDAIVMDVFMPRRDGLDAMATLAASDDTADIPVLLMSGHRGLEAKLKALGLRPADHLPKPFAVAELLTRVDAVLRRRHGAALDRRILGNDPETGLFDQLGLVRRLEEELSRNQRFARPLPVAILRPSVAPGPRVRLVAGALRRQLRPPEVAAHLGRGVIALVFPEAPPAVARAQVEELLRLPEVQPWGYSSRLKDLGEHHASAASALEQLLT